MSIPPTFDSDCGCVGGPCNPIGKCCSGNINNDPGDNNSCSQENTGILSTYQWPVSHMNENTASPTVDISQYVFPFHLTGGNCNAARHESGETDGATKYNTFSTVENGVCDLPREVTTTGFLLGNRLNQDLPVVKENNQGIEKIRIKYRGSFHINGDKEILNAFEDFTALVLKVRVINQTGLRDQDGTAISGIPALSSRTSVGQVYTYRFPFDAEGTSASFGLKYQWDNPSANEVVINIGGDNNNLDSECSDEWPDFPFQYNPTTHTVTTTGLDTENNLWGIRFEYWWYIEGSMPEQADPLSNDCSTFGTLASNTCDGKGGTFGQTGGVITDDGTGLGCQGIDNTFDCGGSIGEIGPDTCVCDICDCVNSLPVGNGCGDISQETKNQLEQICACCKGIGGEFNGIICGDKCDSPIVCCNGCLEQNITCEICDPNNLFNCCDCARGTAEFITFDQCMSKLGTHDSLCWSPNIESEDCPCLTKSEIDECGCFVDGGCVNNNYLSCVNGGCPAFIPPTCGGGEVVKEFTFEAYDSTGTLQDGITFGLSAPYNQQIEYGLCGEMSGQAGFEQQEYFVWSNAYYILGNMPITFDKVKACFIKSFSNQGILARQPDTEKIAIKQLQFCNSDINGECGDCDFADVVSGPPILAKGVYTTLKLTNNNLKFKRTNQFNKLIGFNVVNGEVSDSSSILTTNGNYTISATEDTSTLLNNGFELTEIAKAMKDTTEKDKVAADFTKLDSTWYAATYCKHELLQNSTFRQDAYAFLSDSTSGWWNTDPSDPNYINVTYLRLWSTQVRSVYKFCYDFSTDDCTENVDDSFAQCYFRLDHEYVKDSQTERGIVKSAIGDTGVYQQTGTNCEDTSTCVYCNPWIANGNVAQRCNSYIDVSGNFVTEAAGAMLMPMRPHTYTVEVWYVADAGGPCSRYERDYPTDFKLAGIIQSVPNCLNAAENLEDTIKQYANDPSSVYNIYYDSCGSFFWQFKNRTEDLKHIVLLNSHTEDFSSSAQNPNFAGIQGVDASTITREIKLVPDVTGTTSSYLDRVDEANDVPTIKAVSAQNWNEDTWYHTDPKHDFNLVAKGKPQVMARWTELPFKNYANEYLDLDETQLGFYLTVSTAHMDGIESVKFYLDGATSGDGVATLDREYKHPKETSVAKVKRDDNGNLLDSLEEYTVRVETDALTSGVHEVRARIKAKSRTDGLGVGTSRLLYGEPPTGNAEVLLSGETSGGRTEGEYKNWGPISGEDFPLSKAVWPETVPDGPELLRGANDLLYKNRFPAIGSSTKWNLASTGFNYYNSGGAKVFYNKNRYIFGATSQQNILFNGYESFWFNYNPAPVQVVVGTSSEVSGGTADVTTVAAAFALLNTGSAEAARHDAEIILNPGTTSSPRKYHWPNAKDSETLTYTEGANWCRNALQKKSLVIKSKNPDSKSKTILWFPPGSDKVDMAWDSFALHVKDLTVYTSFNGASVNQCLKSTGSNCRLLIENVDFTSACVDGIKGSLLVDSSGDIICGDTLTRAANGSVAGQIQYNKCRKVLASEDNYQCSSDLTVCGVNCCGVLANGSGCADCTTASCNYCKANCTCRMSEVQWWPYFCSNSVDLSASNGTNLAAEITCGSACTNDAASACKGIFGSDLVHTSSYFCLGTVAGQCIILGRYNHDLMVMADNNSWAMGIYAKSITSGAVPGPVVKNPVMVKHFTVENMTDNLICDEGHSLIIDLWVKNVDNYSDPDKKDTDIVKWSLDDFNTKYGIKVIDDYTSTIGNPNPRGIYNFNSFVENRMMINIKVDNCHSRIINMPGPSLTIRDILGSYNGSFSGVAGHKNNFGCWTFRNFLFKDFHLDEKANSHQIFGHNAINHLYFDNFVVASDVSKYCLSTDLSTDACKNTPEGPLFPLSDGAVSSLSTKYLHYGRKQVQNLFIKDSVFHNLSTSALLLETLYPSSIDFGTRKDGFSGSNFAVNNNSYFWRGSHGVKIQGLRQVKNDYNNTALLTDPYNVIGSSFGPVVHYRSSPPVGRTSAENISNLNPYGSSTQWLADSPTSKQIAIFGTDSSSRITATTPTICKTFVQGSVFKTADNKDACYDTTNGTCSGESDPFQFPSAAHSSFISSIEALSSGNLLRYGIPNVGGMKLSFANTKNYYHDICKYESFKCTRSGSRDARTNQDESLTVISYDSGGGTYSWISNTEAECSDGCLNIRDHYFVDSDNYPVDLSWIPVVDECTCCDIDSTCTSVS